MYSSKSITFAEVRNLCKQHPVWIVICLVLCIAFELYFFNYPPRGVKAEDTIVVGSLVGKTLVNFETIWVRYINDDTFMLNLIDKLALVKSKSIKEQIRFLNASIRPNLSFEKVGQTIVRIKFQQPGYKNVRPFLNQFTKSLMTNFDKIAKERLDSIISKKKLVFKQLMQKIFQISEIFHIPNYRVDFTNSDSIKDNLPSNTDYAATGSCLLTNIGKIANNNLIIAAYDAYEDIQNCVAKDKEILMIFPRKSILLTCDNTPPVPIQPFISLFYLLIPGAWFIVCLSGLLLFENSKPCLNNQ